MRAGAARSHYPVKHNRPRHALQLVRPALLDHEKPGDLSFYVRRDKAPNLGRPRPEHVPLYWAHHRTPHRLPPHPLARIPDRASD
jgi:hypothetical protein